MKRTQLLDARRNIRKEIVAFLSIVLIGMLAAVAYLSIAYSASALKKDALNFFNTWNFWDFEITSTMLMDDEDLEAIRCVPGVQDAEGVFQTDATMRIDGSTANVSLLSLPENISLPVLSEGRLPEAAMECAVEGELVKRYGLSIGQQISVETSQIAGVDPLQEKTFVITGLFHSPEHITFMIQVTPYILVCKESFNLEGLDNAFMKAHVRVADAPENRYSDEYWDSLSPVSDALNALAAQRAPARREKVYSIYEGKIREGEEALEKSKKMLDDGREKLAQGQRDLETAAEELGYGKKLLDYYGDELVEAEIKIEEGRVQLEYLKMALDYLENVIARGREWILENFTEEDWPQGIDLTYAEFMRAIESGVNVTMSWLYEYSGYNTGEQLLEIAPKALETAKNTWYYNGEQYLDGVTRYEKGLRQLEEGRQQLEEGQEKYDEAEKELRKAKKELEQLGECRWVVLNDRGNAGFVYAEGNADKLSSLSMSFSSIFLVVGALVIYATIARMVEQHRKLIGATKALGFYNGEIFAKYLYFACSAAILGIILGILAAWLPLQRVVLNSYDKLFTYGKGAESFTPLDTGLVIAGAFLIAVAAVYLGCGALLRLPATSLLRGTMPSAGRKKARRSAEKSLYTRLIYLNMRTDWNRVLVTTVSVAGGCMLLVIGFTLRFGIGGVTGRQYGEIITYDAEIYYNTDGNDDTVNELDDLFERNALPHINLRKASGVFEEDETLSSCTMIISGKGDLNGYFLLKDIGSGRVFDLPESGMLVPRRFSEYYRMNIGDRVSIYSTEMTLREIEIAGIFENYYGQLFFLSPEGYEEAFGAPPENNCFFVKTGGMSLRELEQMVSQVEGFEKIVDAAADRIVIEQFSSSLNFVVYLMLFIAAMMACFIVANFTMTYIQRKTSELTIMRINGFTVGECIRYAAVDLAVTTVAGTLLGLFLGGILGERILMVTETAYIQMVREPSVLSYLYSGLLTLFFSASTNGFALQKVKRLRLADLSG